MRYALLLVTLLLSVATDGADSKKQTPVEKGGPWEKDWAPNAGDCVAVGEMPNGVTCKLYSHGREGFVMRIYVYEERQSRYLGAETFFDVAQRLCSSLGTPVEIYFSAGKLDRTVKVQPPNCQQPAIS